MFAPQNFTSECRFRTNSTPNPEKRRVRPDTSNHSLPNREIGHRGPVEIDIAAITVDATWSCFRDSTPKIAKKPGNRIETVHRERDWLQGGKIRKTCDVLTNRDSRKERALCSGKATFALSRFSLTLRRKARFAGRAVTSTNARRRARKTREATRVRQRLSTVEQRVSLARLIPRQAVARLAEGASKRGRGGSPKNARDTR